MRGPRRTFGQKPRKDAVLCVEDGQVLVQHHLQLACGVEVEIYMQC